MQQERGSAHDACTDLSVSAADEMERLTERLEAGGEGREREERVRQKYITQKL